MQKSERASDREEREERRERIAMRMSENQQDHRAGIRHFFNQIEERIALKVLFKTSQDERRKTEGKD